MKILVTGGGGFLGQALCGGLRARGHEVVSLNRRVYPALDALNVRQVLGDIAHRDAVVEAARGCEAIFHNAALTGGWGPFAQYHATNVVGTQNVIDACREHGIGRLVYTSTPSVTHRATFPVAGLAADAVPYGDALKSAYAQTKKLAEQRVLAANDAGLAVVVLRPRLIWGPGDNQLLPRLVERARSGRLRLVGDGSNLIDTTYIDNAADAHIKAFEQLTTHSACAGRAYFISNGEPRSMRDTLNALLAAVDAPQVTRTLPFAAAYALGATCEAVWTLLPLRGEPPMTRFLAEQLSTTHWYDIEPTRRDFGWTPRVTFDEGLQCLGDAWRAAHPAASK